MRLLGGVGSTMEKENKSFLRNLSRKKSVKLAHLPSGESTPGRVLSRKKSSKVLQRGDSTPGRSLSRKRSLCEKLSRRDDPLYGSRAKTDTATLTAKKAVVEQCEELHLVEPMDKVEELVICGANSLRAEVIDLNAMIGIMKQHMTMLSHDIVERVFEWMPLFKVYVERLVLVEEEWIVQWVESKGALKGSLKGGVRMALRGRVQRAVTEMIEVRDEFMPHLPAGERLPRLVERVEEVTGQVVKYVEMMKELAPIVRERFVATDIEKQRLKMMKHVVGHVGYEDFVVVYTRWMAGGLLLEWKTRTLFPCDFRFFSYGGWERDMDAAHYCIAGGFGGWVEREEREVQEMNRVRKEEFERALKGRLEMGVGEEIVEEEEYDDEDY